MNKRYSRLLLCSVDCVSSPFFAEFQGRYTDRRIKVTRESDSDPQMVHRPADTRLLVNLLSHEKDYSKHLQSLLDSSHASLASFSAFAAASSAPLSQIVLSIAAYFSSADDALRRYKDAVDAWREQLKTLKDFEAEISNIARDRDILYVLYCILNSVLNTFQCHSFA